MTNALNRTQALLLFGLLARHGACAQAELVPKIKKADRVALSTAGLCRAERQGRAYQLTLTDAGWAWAADHLTAALPPAQRTLADLLARLDDYLQRSGATIADIIGSGDPGAQPSTAVKPKRKSGGKPSPLKKTAKKAGASRPRKPAQSPLPSLRLRIEQAYLTLTNGQRNESVRLAALRESLSEIDRATLDAGLRDILKSDETAFLLRHDDPKQLTKADHDAAFNPFGEPYHVLRIV